MFTMSDIATNDIPEITLGWRLRMAMERAGLKAEEMADMMDVHRGTITRWTHDIGAAPRPIYLQKWAEICRVRYDWLAGGAADRPRAGNGGPIRRVKTQSSRGCVRWTRHQRSYPRLHRDALAA
jgi:transcriptional regulator with XRE-family HTH domain